MRKLLHVQGVREGEWGIHGKQPSQGSCFNWTLMRKGTEAQCLRPWQKDTSASLTGRVQWRIFVSPICGCKVS